MTESVKIMSPIMDDKKYAECYKVLAHDVDAKYMMKPSAYFRYMQETANHQMRDCRPTYEELLAEGRAFILSRMSLKILSSPKQYERITVETWAGEDKGMLFKRCYRMLGENGELCAEGMSDWALVDVNEQAFVKYDAKLFSSYPRSRSLEGFSMRFRIPKAEFTCVGNRTVIYNDLDVNGHMNNTVYPDIITGYCPQIFDCSPSAITVSYLSEAKLGEEMNISVFTTDENGKSVSYVRSLIGDRTNVEAKIEF